MFKKIIYVIITRINLAYIEYLREEKRRAEEYLDRLNETRNFNHSHDLYSGSWGFRQQWFEYEEEYAYNFNGLK